MSPEPSPSSTFSVNPRILGTCWLVYGIIRLLIAALLSVFFATATVMFGAVLVRVPDPYSLLSLFHLFYIVAIVLLVAGGIVGILAGLALLSGQAAARKLAVIAAFLCLSEIPAGTTLGVYTLIVFLR